MKKYTQGPWFADGLVVTNSHVPKDRLFIAQMICGRPSQEDEANCHLIAAAPELLEASKLALAYLQKEGFHDGDAYPALLKAIAKAEGDTE